MSKVKAIIDGVDYEVEKDEVILVIGNRVLKNHAIVTERSDKPLDVVISGELATVFCNLSLTVNGNVHGDAKAGTSMICGNVNGDIKTGTYAKCGGVRGSVNSGTYTECKDVGGDVKSGTKTVIRG